MDELMEVTHFHLSLNNIKNFFVELFKNQCSIQWAGPSAECLMRALMIATSHSTSFERNHPKHFIESTQEEIFAKMVGKMAGKECTDSRIEIIQEARKGVTSYLHSQHLGLPRLIPANLIDLYKKETGRDIAKTWQIDHETRLSPIACCFSACDMFLVIPPGDDKQKRSVIRDHLHMCCQNSIPGLHRCVVRHSHLPTSTIISIVESGSELGEPFLPREVTRRLSKGVGVYGGVPNSFSSADEYKRKALQIEYESVPKKIKAAIEDFTGGDSVVLYHAIEDLKINLTTDVWSYSSFKKTFDAKYKELSLESQ